MSVFFHSVQTALAPTALALIGKRRLIPDADCQRLIKRRMAEAA